MKAHQNHDQNATQTKNAILLDGKRLRSSLTAFVNSPVPSTTCYFLFHVLCYKAPIARCVTHVTQRTALVV